MINLDDKYNNTYHKKIKMKPIGVNSSKYIDFDVENNETDLKFKVGNHVTISIYKNILPKSYTPNWSKEVFIKKVKKTVSGTYVISGLNGGKLLESFMKKNCKRQIKWNVKGNFKKKGDKLYIKQKSYDDSFNSSIGKTMSLYNMSKHFPKTYERSGENIKVESNLSNYATKADLREATGVDKSNLATKPDLARLKAEVDKIDTD